MLAALIPDDPDQVLLDNTVTYAFAASGISVDTRSILGRNSISVAWSEAQVAFVEDLFDYIETVVDLTFEEVSDGLIDIEFQQVRRLDGETIGFARLEAPGQSTIVIPTAFTGPTFNGVDNVTVIHEIGHALGLDHPFEGTDAFPGINDDPFDPGDFALNTELATRMSYAAGESYLYPDLDIMGEAVAFGALDIAALQLLYGANETTGAGDTSYGDDPGLLTIWDTGGNDSIDYSDATDNAVIDLRAATLEIDEGGGGYLSFIGLENGTVAEGGYTIAFGVEIEGARGGSGDDMITGNTLDNLLSGNAGNDMFDGNAGNDTIDGGDGLDTSLYAGNQENYTLTLDAQGTVLTDRREGAEGTDTLINVEAVAFGDNTDGSFDLTKFAGTQMLTETQMESFIELYIAYFDRAPDAVGLNFWGTAFATGTTLKEMAAFFTDQSETMAAYPESLSNAELTAVVYDNVLGREGDAEGVDFWVGVLDSGAGTRDQFVLSVLEGAKTPIDGATPEQVQQQIADQAYLSAKTDIGAYYSVIKGLSDVEDAQAAMALYDGTSDSIVAAQNAIEGFYGEALDADNGAFILQLVGVVEDPFAVVV